MTSRRTLSTGMALALLAGCSADPERDALSGEGRRGRASSETSGTGATARDAAAPSGATPSSPGETPTGDVAPPIVTYDAGAPVAVDAGTGTTTPPACGATCFGLLGTCGCRLAGVRSMACQDGQCACLESGSLQPTTTFTADVCGSRDEMREAFIGNCGCL